MITRSEIVRILTEHGICGVTSKQSLSAALGISHRTIQRCVRKQHLNQTDGVFYLEDIVSWLEKNPRFIAKREPQWEVYENTSRLIETIIRKSWLILLDYWDMPDLIAEVQFRMLHMRKNSCSESTVIIRILANIWKKQNQIKTIPIGKVKSL